MKTRIILLYELIMFFLAILSLLFIWKDDMISDIIHYGVWLIFTIDVIIRFVASKNKKHFVKKNLLEIIATIPLDNIFQMARIFRLLRLIRVLITAYRFAKPFLEILKLNGLNKVLYVAVILIFLASIPIYFVEPSINSYSDGLWWSIVTTTTVGYGDISPETPIGRLIATFLMVFGIGLIGMVTSSIATYFIQHKENVDNQTIHFMKKQLDRIDELNNSEIDQLKLLLDTYKKK